MLSEIKRDLTMQMCALEERLQLDIQGSYPTLYHHWLVFKDGQQNSWLVPQPQPGHCLKWSPADMVCYQAENSLVSIFKSWPQSDLGYCSPRLVSHLVGARVGVGQYL